MAGPTRIHHVNFVVRDLDAAIARYTRELGVGPFIIVEHAVRGSRVARARVGETWFVLVCPDDEASVPGRFLREHGEGFFLLSFGVEQLDAALSGMTSPGAVRSGIEDWRVADIGRWFGADLQLTEDRAPGDA